MSRWSRSILVVGALVIAGLVVTSRWLGAENGYVPHLLVALGVTLLALFAHLWVWLFLLSSGRLLDRTVRAAGLPAEISGEARRLRRRCWPWLGAAVVMLLAAFISGGGVSTGYVAAKVHRAAFWLVLGVQVLVLWIEGRALGANDRLMERVKSALP